MNADGRRRPAPPRALDRGLEGSPLDVRAMSPARHDAYTARYCVWTLARAHARTGDRVAIAAYLGVERRVRSALSPTSRSLRGPERARLRRAGGSRTRMASSPPSAASEPRVANTARLPIVGWLPRYDRRWLRGDVAAGIAVTALIVPKNLGYAGIAGVPLQNGLYAAAAGGIIYALFCTSRHISTGPSSSLAAVAGGAVVGDRRRPGSRRRSWSRRSPSRPACCSSCSRCSAWAGSPASCRRRWSRASWPEPPSTWSIGELPKLTGTAAEGDSAWRELASWLGVAR